MDKLQTVLRCPFGIYKTLVPRGDGLADDRHDIEIPQTLKTPQLPASPSSLPSWTRRYRRSTDLLPESVQPQPLGRRDALGRAVRGCPSSWPSLCAWCARLDHGSMAPWLRGSTAHWAPPAG
jgi:hypothetical protein